MSRYCRKQGQVLSDMHWCETCPPANSQPETLSVVDVPGEPIRLMLNGGRHPLRYIEIEPKQALALAADLIEGARRRLNANRP